MGTRSLIAVQLDGEYKPTKEEFLKAFEKEEQADESH